MAENVNITTTVKQIKLKCFGCLDAAPSRLYKVGSKKWIEENGGKKLDYALVTLW